MNRVYIYRKPVSQWLIDNISINADAKFAATLKPGDSDLIIIRDEGCLAAIGTLNEYSIGLLSEGDIENLMCEFAESSQAVICNSEEEFAWHMFNDEPY